MSWSNRPCDSDACRGQGDRLFRKNECTVCHTVQVPPSVKRNEFYKARAKRIPWQERARQQRAHEVQKSEALAREGKSRDFGWTEHKPQKGRPGARFGRGRERTVC